MTFKRALEISQSNETASARAKQLQNPRSAREAEKPINKLTTRGQSSGVVVFAVGIQTTDVPSANTKTTTAITVGYQDICKGCVSLGRVQTFPGRRNR